MAKKIATLDAALLKRIKKLGINSTSEEDVRKKLLALLEKQGIEGMEEEDTETLLEMAESFVEDDDNETDDEEMDDEELAHSMEDEDDEEDDDEPTDEDLDELADEVDDEPAPKKAKKAEPAPKKEKKETKKAEKKETKKVNKRGTKLLPKTNEDDRQYFDVFKGLFPDETCQYDWVQSGVTIKNKGTNSNRAMVLIENCSLKDDGTVRCNLYLLTMTKKKDILDEKGIDYKDCWSGQPFCNGITFEEAIAIITELKDEITGFVTKVDKKLGENRKKMEDNLKSAAKKKETPAKEKKATAKKATKNAEPEVDDEVDDEVED